MKNLAQALNPSQPRISTLPQVIHKPDCLVHNIPQVQGQPQLGGLYQQASPSALQQTDDCFGQTAQGQRIGRVPDLADLQREKDKLSQQRQMANPSANDVKKFDKPDVPSQMMDRMKTNAGANPVAKSISEPKASNPNKNSQTHPTGKSTYFGPSKASEKMQ